MLWCLVKIVREVYGNVHCVFMDRYINIKLINIKLTHIHDYHYSYGMQIVASGLCDFVEFTSWQSSLPEDIWVCTWQTLASGVRVSVNVCETEKNWMKGRKWEKDLCTIGKRCSRRSRRPHPWNGFKKKKVVLKFPLFSVLSVT